MAQHAPLTILFTFALGTSAGDLAAEKPALGYLPSALVFAGPIAIIFAAPKLLKANAILAFWPAHLLTRVGPPQPLRDHDPRGIRVRRLRAQRRRAARRRPIRGGKR